MTGFSLFRHVQREATARGVAVRALGPTRLSGGEGSVDADAFDTRVESMRMWCRVAERVVIARCFEDAVIHAGFERLSRLRPVLERYRQMAATASTVHVYGEADFAPDGAGLRAVALTSGPLLDEWFLVVDAKDWKAVIVARDLDGLGGSVPLHARRFRGIASHHPGLVTSARVALERYAAGLEPSTTPSSTRTESSVASASK